MKPKRPHMPIAVKIAVVERQLLARGAKPDAIRLIAAASDNKSHRLSMLIRVLGLDEDRVEFDHVPALGLRRVNSRRTDWIPPANDPDYIEAKDAEPHLEKTAGRGGASMRFGGDTRAIAKVRRIEREPERWTGLTKPKRRRKDKPVTRRARKIPNRPFPKTSRPFPSAKKGPDR